MVPFYLKHHIKENRKRPVKYALLCIHGYHFVLVSLLKYVLHSSFTRDLKTQITVQGAAPFCHLFYHGGAVPLKVPTITENATIPFYATIILIEQKYRAIIFLNHRVVLTVEIPEHLTARSKRVHTLIRGFAIFV